MGVFVKCAVFGAAAAVVAAPSGNTAVGGVFVVLVVAVEVDFAFDEFVDSDVVVVVVEAASEGKLSPSENEKDVTIFSSPASGIFSSFIFGVEVDSGIGISSIQRGISIIPLSSM